MSPERPSDLEAEIDRQLDLLWSGVDPRQDGATLRAALVDAVADGKRVRPGLLLGVHAELGGEDVPAAMRAAAAVELLHTAFVVHDDLIDGDDVRRGRPSVPGAFRAAALDAGAPDRPAASYAVAGSVLAGDLALSAALRGFAVLPVRETVRVRILDHVTRALATSAAGELADVRMTFGDHWVDHDEVLELAARKTAAYSFELPMVVGALLADAAPATVEALGRAGRALGIGFQLEDDLSGIFDDHDQTGKDPVADLREGKLTMIVLHAAATSAWPVVGAQWGRPDVTPADLDAVRQALEGAGSRAYVERLARRHLAEGLEHLSEAGLDAAAADRLLDSLGRPAEAAA